MPPAPAQEALSSPPLALEQFGSGEPLVLIHGLATTRAIWNTVAPTLARSRRVVTLDVPGFGGSAVAGTGFDLNDVAERIADGLEGEGLADDGFDLVGHSLGAGIALTLAASRPEIVRRLILVAPAGLRPVPKLASMMVSTGVDALLAIRRRLVPLSDLSWGRRLLLVLAADDPAAISPTQARMMIEASASAQRTAAAFRAITAADLRPLLRQMQAPLGVIWGARDRTVPPSHGDVIREARPDAEFVVIERAGHVVMVERPEEFGDALEGLLRTLPKDATTAGACRSRLS